MCIYSTGSRSSGCGPRATLEIKRLSRMACIGLTPEALGNALHARKYSALELLQLEMHLQSSSAADKPDLLQLVQAKRAELIAAVCEHLGRMGLRRPSEPTSAVLVACLLREKPAAQMRDQHNYTFALAKAM